VVLPSTSQFNELDDLHKRFGGFSVGQAFISHSIETSLTSALSEWDSEAEVLAAFLPAERPAINDGRKGRGGDSTLCLRDRPTSHGKNRYEGDGKFPGKGKEAKGSKHACSEFSYYGMETPFVWVTAV
jgi:hypothetical protein